MVHCGNYFLCLSFYCMEYTCRIENMMWGSIHNLTSSFLWSEDDFLLTLLSVVSMRLKLRESSPKLSGALIKLILSNYPGLNVLLLAFFLCIRNSFIYLINWKTFLSNSSTIKVFKLFSKIFEKDMRWHNNITMLSRAKLSLMYFLCLMSAVGCIRLFFYTTVERGKPLNHIVTSRFPREIFSAEIVELTMRWVVMRETKAHLLIKF